MSRWECRDLGEVKEYLGMNIKRDGCTIRFDQCSYLEKILTHFGLFNCKSVTTPLPNYKSADNLQPVNAELRSRYQAAIGSLLYIMLGTCPDITYSIIWMSQFSANPSQDHYNKVLQILRYLAGTRNYYLEYNGKSQMGISAHSDSDWAENKSVLKDQNGKILRRRSQTGYFFKLANGSICWNSLRKNQLRFHPLRQNTWRCQIVPAKPHGFRCSSAR
jgi:hypothetical protein